ncbi:type I DNA topoisomerase [Suttonella ornithocola]|uniref:DNA topoisomerase 1 n=1 Tax=Suttonella ornithocola TaxID=279832 RepID=A0A380MPN3_9GAMM|nr:type I DNA topoisomerase [Suttonella ornithocola]SUO94570.1 DNA topoisomerase 1 [Suttonella ornithocola]
MSKHLIVVESPAKAKTLHKYLGKDYEVLASYGHVRDLVPKNGAVEPDNNFAMNYEVIERNAKHVNNIVKALKNADDLLLATDPDREGEAISWHLYELLKEQGALTDKPVHRVVFHEITKRAILNAVETPRQIAMDLVNAQQARRALDYLVGFNLSPLLWRKVQPGLSAGRVQSPALRMIVEREREIEAFKTQEYWKIFADSHHQEQAFKANLSVYAGEKVEQFSFTEEEQVNKVISELKKLANGTLTVAEVIAKDRKRNPAAPFITSTLQQEAARKLRFTAQRTMRVAQRLYEEGYITYMRTDSVNLAQEAIVAIREWVEEQYGKTYLPKTPRSYTTKSKNAQEAHEAIRPTDIKLDSNALPADMTVDERKLYDLIRKRALASQMASAVMEQVSVVLHAGSEAYQFRATGSTIKFPGFMSVYLEDQDDTSNEEDEGLLPAMKVGEKVALKDILGTQHFTAPPPRYSEASLIKALEEKGIGRPSTYASIISTLLNREYVELDARRFIPTSIGKVVNDFLTNHFERYVDYDFTANLEDDLDAVSRGEQEWKPLLGSFWQNFSEKIEEKKDISREEVMQARELGQDSKSGKPISVRFGRFGPFVQRGSKDDEDKPDFASIPPEWDFEKITLEQALELFKLPRTLGQNEEDGEIVTNIGRFGPYIRFGKKFVSLPKEENPFTVTLERALELIAEKKEADRQKYIKEIKNQDEILQVLNGRFGPYVTNGSINASIPKKMDPQTLTLPEALELLEKAQERKAKRGSKKTASNSTKKTTSKAKSTEAKKKTSAGKTTRRTSTRKTANKSDKKSAK